MNVSRIASFFVLLMVSHIVAATPRAEVVFSPYTDITINTHWNAEFQDLEPDNLKKTAMDNHIKAYHLAFITDSGQCQAAWGGQPTYSIESQWGKRLTDELAKNGVDVTVAFGGERGIDPSMNCSEIELVNLFKQTILTYKAKKLDFDIENGTANVPKLMRALKEFQHAHPNVPISFTLPVLPEGLTPQGKDILAEAADTHLNFNVNIMAMDYGPAYKGDMAEYAKGAGIALHTYLKTLFPEEPDETLWKKIEITPMIGVNDVNTEQFTLANVKTLRDFATSHQLGGLSMWSLARDKPCDNKWASATCSGNNLQQYEYEFVHTFLSNE